MLCVSMCLLAVFAMQMYSKCIKLLISAPSPSLACVSQVPDTIEAAIREADVLDQDGNISLEEFEALIHSADTDVLDLFDTRHHK